MNQKGGVGKTTTAANLGAALAYTGRRVLLIDLDPQGNLSTHLGVEVPPESPSTYSVLCEGMALAEATVPTAIPNLSLVGTNIDLSGAEMELAAAIGRESILNDAVDQYEASTDEAYDYILFDCPPSLGLLSVNGLVAAREVFIALQTEFFALQGMSKLVEIVQLLKKRLNPALEISGIIPCLYDSRLRLAREVLAEIRRYFPGPVFRRSIRANVKLAEAPSYGQSIFEYAPSSPGASDYMDLALEVVEMEAPGSVPERTPVPLPGSVSNSTPPPPRPKREAQAATTAATSDATVEHDSAPSEDATTDTSSASTSDALNEPQAETAPSPASERVPTAEASEQALEVEGGEHPIVAAATEGSQPELDEHNEVPEANDVSRHADDEDVRRYVTGPAAQAAETKERSEAQPSNTPNPSGAPLQGASNAEAPQHAAEDTPGVSAEGESAHDTSTDHDKESAVDNDSLDAKPELDTQPEPDVHASLTPGIDAPSADSQAAQPGDDENATSTDDFVEEAAASTTDAARTDEVTSSSSEVANLSNHRAAGDAVNNVSDPMSSEALAEGLADSQETGDQVPDSQDAADEAHTSRQSEAASEDHAQAEPKLRASAFDDLSSGVLTPAARPRSISAGGDAPSRDTPSPQGSPRDNRSGGSSESCAHDANAHATHRPHASIAAPSTVVQPSTSPASTLGTTAPDVAKASQPHGATPSFAESASATAVAELPPAEAHEEPETRAANDQHSQASRTAVSDEPIAAVLSALDVHTEDAHSTNTEATNEATNEVSEHVEFSSASSFTSRPERPVDTLGDTPAEDPENGEVTSTATQGHDDTAPRAAAINDYDDTSIEATPGRTASKPDVPDAPRATPYREVLRAEDLPPLPEDAFRIVR